MKEKYFKILLVLCTVLLAFSLTACGGKKNTEDKDDDWQDDGDYDSDYDPDWDDGSDGGYSGSNHDNDYGEQDAKNHGYSLKVQMIDERNAVIIITDSSLGQGFPVYDSSVEEGRTLKSYQLSMESDEITETKGTYINIDLTVNNQYQSTAVKDDLQVPGEYNNAYFFARNDGYNGISLSFPEPQVLVNGNDIIFICSIPDESDITFENVWYYHLCIGENNYERGYYSDYTIENILTQETVLSEEMLSSVQNFEAAMTVQSEKEASFLVRVKNLSELIKEDQTTNIFLYTPWFNGSIAGYTSGVTAKPESMDWSFNYEDGFSINATYCGNETFEFTVRETEYTDSEDWDFTENDGIIRFSTGYEYEPDYTFTEFMISEIKTNGTNGLYAGSKLNGIKSGSYTYPDEVKGYSEAELDSLFFRPEQSADCVFYKGTKEGYGYISGVGSLTYNYDVNFSLTIANDSVAVCSTKYVFDNADEMHCQFGTEISMYISDGDIDSLLYTEATTDTGKAIVYIKESRKLYYSYLPDYSYYEGSSCKEKLKNSMSDLGYEKTDISGTACEPFVYASQSSSERITNVNSYAMDALSFRPMTEDYIIEELFEQEGAAGLHDFAVLYSYSGGTSKTRQVREVYRTAGEATARYDELSGACLAGSIVYYTEAADVTAKTEKLAAATSGGRFVSVKEDAVAAAYSYKRTECTADYSSMKVTLSQPESNRIIVCFTNPFAKETYIVNKSGYQNGTIEFDMSVSFGDWEKDNNILIGSHWYTQYSQNAGYLGSNASVDFCDLDTELNVGESRYDSYASGKYVSSYMDGKNQVWDIVFPSELSVSLDDYTGTNLYVTYGEAGGITVNMSSTIDASIITEYSGIGSTRKEAATVDDPFTARPGDYVYLPEADTEVEVKKAAVDQIYYKIYDSYSNNSRMGVFQADDGFLIKYAGAGNDAMFEIKTMVPFWSQTSYYGTAEKAVISGTTYYNCRIRVRFDSSAYIYYDIYDGENLLLTDYYSSSSRYKLIEVAEWGLGTYYEDDGSSVTLYKDKYGILLAEVAMADGYSTTLWGLTSTKSTDTSVYYEAYDENSDQLKGNIYLYIDEATGVYKEINLDMSYGSVILKGNFDNANPYIKPDTYPDYDSMGAWGLIPADEIDSAYFQPETEDYIVQYITNAYTYNSSFTTDDNMIYYEEFTLYSYNEFGRTVNTKMMYRLENEAEAEMLEAYFSSDEAQWWSGELNDTEVLQRDGSVIYRYEVGQTDNIEYNHTRNHKAETMMVGLGFFFGQHYVEGDYADLWISKPISEEEGTELVRLFYQYFTPNIGSYRNSANDYISLSGNNPIIQMVQLPVQQSSMNSYIIKIKEDGTVVAVGKCEDVYVAAELVFSEDHTKLTYSYNTYSKLPGLDTYQSMTAIQQVQAGTYSKTN